MLEPGDRRRCPTAPRRCSTPPTRPSTSTPRAARARARRGRHHRPLRRLHAGLPGRRPHARRRRGGGGRALGHRRPAPAPHRRPRPRARGRAWPASRGATGSRAQSLEFHQRVRQAFVEMAAADPDHYLVLDARAADRARSPPRSASASSPCWPRRGRDERLGRPGRPAAGRRDAAPRRRGRGDDPRVAVHRSARLRPLQRRPRLRRGPAVRDPHRVRRVRGVPHSASTAATPTSSGSHSETLVALRRRHARPRAAAAKFPSVGRWQIVVDRGRRPARHPGEPAHRQRAAQGDRGAHPATVWLLCAPTVRGRAAHDPLALPPRHPRHPDAGDVAAFLVRTDGIDRHVAAFAARASQGHIGRARALALDEDTREPAPRGRVAARAADRARRLHDRGHQPRRARQGGDRGDHRRRSSSASCRSSRRSSAVERKDGASRSYRAALAALEKLQKQKAKRRVLDVIDRGADGPRLGLPRRHRAAVGAPGHAGQRGAARRRRDRRARRHARASCCA